MSTPDAQRRIREAIVDEIADGVEGWYYLSFVHPERPKGDRFVGGCYVRALGMATAISRTHALGINPGGEVQIHGPYTDEALDEHVAVKDRERLLTREEINPQ